MTYQAGIEQYRKENALIKEQIEKNSGKTSEQLYEEREKRVRDSVYLKQADRVPFMVHIDAQIYTGIPNSAAYYDPIAFKRSMRKITVDLEPDMCNAGLPTSGAALATLDVKNRLWPGGPLPTNYEYQFVEGEYMKENEYDLFLSDPSGFMLGRFLPRMYGALLPLEKLPRLDVMFQGFEGLTPLFASPEFIRMAGRLAEAGRQMQEFRQAIGHSYEELAELGFPAWAPVITGGVGGAPFDTVSSFLRGMKGSMTDMYRQPEKLIKACEMIVERRIAGGIPAASLTTRGNPKMIGMPLWRGDKAFMSEAQFARFYWPGLKRALQATIDLGYVPVPFFEAEFGDRLQRLLELPPGKTIASVETVDAVKAKQILGGHTCILVRAPHSSKLWSLQQVESFTRDLIDKCGKKGGLLLDIRLPDKAKTEDIRAMLKSINEYSRY